MIDEARATACSLAPANVHLRARLRRITLRAVRLTPLRRVLSGGKPAQQLMTSTLVGACLALQLAGTVHLAVVDHELCADHGVAVDVAEGAHGHGHADRPGQVETRGEPEARSDADRSGSAPAGADHDHCPLAENRSARALVVQAAAVGPRCATIAPDAHVQLAVVALSPSALRLLAPKTSPPA